ncbi:MAG: hypothetical protein ACRCXD_05740 [Luteolibacter sp.]
MNPFLDKLSSWWFPVFPAARLGMLRAAIGSYSLWYLWTRADLLSGVGQTDHGLFDPVGVIHWLGAPLAPGTFDLIIWITIALNVFFVLGVGHRVTGPLFAAALLATLCYRNSWSMIYHMHNALVIHVLVLGVTRAADGFSIDAWLSRRKSGMTPAPGPRYGWPVQLMCLLTLLTYFVSGVAKIASPAGFAWAKGESLRAQIGVDALRKEILGSEPGDLGLMLFDQVWLFTLMGVGTLVLELGAPLFIKNRRLGQVWSLATFGMHWGIFFAMGIRFRYQMSGIMFLTFFDVERALPALRRFAARLPWPRQQRNEMNAICQKP